APDELHWRLNGQNVSVQNSSKYNVTIFDVKYKFNGVSSESKGSMIAPGGSKQFTLKNSGNIDGLSFNTINDYGALISHK
ncbi:hypothetical protein L0N33_23140, partial [Roseburia faecis]|nr:hypothetical protein [Roseburia faecis]